MDKGFVYLYPQKDIFDFEIQRNSPGFDFPGSEEMDKEWINAKGSERDRLGELWIMKQREFFRERLRSVLNLSFDLRYRAKGYQFYFVLLDDGELSPLIELREGDKIIRAGMDSKTHRTKGKDGKYPYPDQEYLLGQISERNLWVSGFHIWDCVSKFARRAYERGRRVMVDEDLTEFLGYNVKDPKFRVESFPGTNPRERFKRDWSMFMRPRKDPWFFKDYH